MRIVRLFVTQDSRRYFLDVPETSAQSVYADVELSGGEVYHAAVLSTSAKRGKKSTGARLKQRLY